MPGHWRVEVIADGEQLVAIESDMLAGKGSLSDADLQTIRKCGAHLLSFAGPDFPATDSAAASLEQP